MNSTQLFCAVLNFLIANSCEQSENNRNMYNQIKKFATDNILDYKNILTKNFEVATYEIMLSLL